MTRFYKWIGQLREINSLGGITRATPHCPETMIHSLPPILRLQAISLRPLSGIRTPTDHIQVLHNNKN